MLEVGSALLVVLGAAALLRAGLGWLGLAPAAGTRRLRVIESAALGARQRVHLVEVAGERLLLGSAESGVRVLRRLPPENQAETESAGAEPETPPARRLPALLRGLAPLLALAWVVLAADPSLAQAGETALRIDLDAATAPEGLSSTLEVLALLTLLSIAPSILLMATCFTRIVIVLAFLRQAIGIHQLPPSQVLVGLAFFLTLFVMAPVGEQVRVEAYEPYLARELDAREAGERALAPIRSFMAEHTREQDLALFLDLAEQPPVEELEAVSLTTLLPAFVISELRTAFEIGFMIYLPFLVVDLVIASMLISMGMIVLPPIVISLPFKLMLFVLLDGWNLVVASLVAGLR